MDKREKWGQHSPPIKKKLSPAEEMMLGERTGQKNEREVSRV